MRDFDGLSAVVTGGASGIGEAIASTLQERGARVYALDRVAAEAGGIDVLVNNAGIGAIVTVADNDLSEWQRVLDVNVLGAVRVSRAALPYLRESSAAAVVMTTSIAAHVAYPSGPRTAPARAPWSRSYGPWPATTWPRASGCVR